MDPPVGYIALSVIWGEILNHNAFYKSIDTALQLNFEKNG